MIPDDIKGLFGDAFTDSGERKSQRGLDGGLEITANQIVIGIADDLDLFTVGTTETNLAGGTKNRQLGRIKADQFTTDPLAGDGINASDNHADGARMAINRTGAFHANDGVDDVDRRV